MKAKLVRESLFEVLRGEDRWADDEIQKWQFKNKAQSARDEILKNYKKESRIKPDSRDELVTEIVAIKDNLGRGYGYFQQSKPKERLPFVKGESDPLFTIKKYHHQRYHQEFMKYCYSLNPNAEGNTLGEFFRSFNDKQLSDIYDKAVYLEKKMDVEEDDWIRGIDDEKSKSLFYEAPEDGPHPGRNWDNGTDWK